MKITEMEIGGSYEVGYGQWRKVAIRAELSEVDNPDLVAKQLSDKVKNITKIIKDLKNASFKDNVMKEAREVFYDKRFKDKLDNNPYLIAFKNGVYDLKADLLRGL